MRWPRRDWWERAFIAMADAGALYGMPPGSVELVVLEQHEREELARERAGLDRDRDEAA